ncbi:MAG: PHP domain-containing protein [Nitrospinae bacterium]|nr:PHP domain-containing protein [Nitrospinota bacterium]
MSHQNGADLHLHSACSDGSESPAQIVRRAMDLDLACVALTDHDTVSGIEEASAEAERQGIEFIPGVEISSHVGEKSVHILGYLMDTQSAPFQKIIVNNQSGRRSRMERMVKKLNEIGYDVTLSGVLEFVGQGTIGRSLLAKYLVKRGFFKNVEDVFHSILGDGKAVYEPVPKFTPEEALALITEAGGVSSLAHPGYTDIDGMIPALVDAGLDGIEVFSPQHDSATSRRYMRMADEMDLVVTGGSDSHGPGMSWRNMGSVRLDYGHVERLKERVNRKGARMAPGGNGI